MNIKDIHSAYFIGIGGIGMSALALWFQHNKVKVAGYDKTPSAITDRLSAKGISVVFDESIAALPDFMQHPDEKVLIVYTPAIPDLHTAFNFLQSNGFTLYKRSEVLGAITRGLFTIAVAGTHGKTTTGSMIAHILIEAGLNTTAFLGGIATNYDTNMVLNTGSMQDAVVVVEADEFDRSFLTLYPNIAVLTSTDADHLDVYGERDALKKSFADFLSNVIQTGAIFIRHKLWEGLESKRIEAVHQGYDINGEAPIHAMNISINNGIFIFDIQLKDTVITDIKLNLPGYHNVENAIAAISVAHSLKIDAGKIKKAMAGYAGVKRRFEYIIKSVDFIFIDDYAHHPTEIEAMLRSVKAMFKEKNLTVLFQPHLFSRTKDFAAEFSKSLSLADEVLLLDIYPARETPIAGINSKMLLNGITSAKKQHLSNKQALAYAAKTEFDVFVTLGAGDIDRLVLPLKEIFLKKHAA